MVKFATPRRPTKGHVQGLTRAKTCYQACVYRCGQDSASRSTHRPRESKMASSMLRTLVCHLHLTLVTTHILFLERPCAGSCDHDFEVCPIGAAWFGCYSGACLLAMCVCVCTLCTGWVAAGRAGLCQKAGDEPAQKTSRCEGRRAQRFCCFLLTAGFLCGDSGGMTLPCCLCLACNKFRLSPALPICKIQSGRSTVCATL